MIVFFNRMKKKHSLRNSIRPHRLIYKCLLERFGQSVFLISKMKGCFSKSKYSEQRAEAMLDKIICLLDKSLAEDLWSLCDCSTEATFLDSGTKVRDHLLSIWIKENTAGFPDIVLVGINQDQEIQTFCESNDTKGWDELRRICSRSDLTAHRYYERESDRPLLELEEEFKAFLAEREESLIASLAKSLKRSDK